MPKRRLLYLTQQQILAFRWHNGALSAEGEFAAETAAGGFAGYLSEHPKSLFSLVVNLGEEGFHSDVIPYLQAKDRDIVISRRLGQTFLGAPLALAVSHGYESGSRKNERLLLTALTGIGQLDPWLSAMQQVGTRLQGVYSLPILSEALLGRLGLKIARGILITVQDSTVRQSFFDGSRLLFSRVAPLVGSSISDMALSISSEANRFQQYLLSQRMVARGDRLQAHVIAHAQAMPAIQAARFNDGIEANIHDIVAASKKIGLKSVPTDNRAQFLFLHCAISAPPRQQFATAALRQPYRVWQAGNAMRAVGALTLVGCLLFTAKLMLDAGKSSNAALDRVRDAESMEMRYQQALGSLPPVPMSNEVLRQLTDRVEKLIRSNDSPTSALKTVTDILDASPQVEIDSIDWLAAGAKGTDSDPASASGATASNKETLLIKGRLNLGTQESPRQLISAFEDLTRRLSASGKSVNVLLSPVNLNASRSVKNTDTPTAARAPRLFAVQVELPVQP